MAVCALTLVPDVAPLAQSAPTLPELVPSGQPLLLLHNGKPLGEMGDTQFARLFFGIWLGPQTSEPEMRSSLLAGTQR